MKKCKTCKAEKPIEDYYIRTKEPLKYFPNCKICYNKKKKDDYKDRKNGKLFLRSKKLSETISLAKKLELEEDLKFRIDCIKALFSIDGFKF